MFDNKRHICDYKCVFITIKIIFSEIDNNHARLRSLT